MTALTAIPPIINDDQLEPCGDDCTYIGLACRCWHGEVVASSFADPVRDNLILPF